MLGGDQITTSDVAAIEIFIEALETHCGKYVSEANATKSMLRKYMDTKAARYYSMAKETFNDINADVRVMINNKANELAANNKFDPVVKPCGQAADSNDLDILQKAMASLRASISAA